jgi:lysozyme
MYLTNEEIETEFFKQIVTYENIVNEAVAVVLNQSKFDALVSFVFNVGGGNFRNSTLLKVINTDSSNPQIKTEFQKWSRAGGKVIQGLLNRRIDEAELYFSEVK